MSAPANDVKDIFAPSSAADDIFGTSTAVPKTRTVKDPNLLIRLLVTDDGLLYDVRSSEMDILSSLKIKCAVCRSSQ